MIAHIDPRIVYRGVSELRKLNAERLRQIDGMIVIQDNDEPLVVIVPYELYLEVQKQRGISE